NAYRKAPTLGLFFAVQPTLNRSEQIVRASVSLGGRLLKVCTGELQLLVCGCVQGVGNKANPLLKSFARLADLPVVMLLHILKFSDGQPRAVLCDVLGQTTPDAESQFAGHNERADDTKFGERVLRAVNFNHTVNDALEELVVARVDFTILIRLGPNIDG